jgi:uncharacterized Zn-finger protein
LKRLQRLPSAFVFGLFFYGPFSSKVICSKNTYSFFFYKTIVGMDTIRARNGHVQQPFPYQTDAYGVQFSDPWNSTTPRPANPTSAPYVGMTSTTMAPQNDLSSLTKPLRQNNLFSTAGFGTTYAEQTTTASPAAGATNYGMNGYSSYDQSSNKNLQSSLVDYSRPQVTSGSYTSADALDSARGMVAMSQNATRFPIQNHPRTSSSSSGSYYPHSTTSSISSASSYPYFGSMDSSATDISSVSDIYDATRPSLPRPAGMIHSQCLPHQSGAQAAMMSTFSSRVSPNTTKKHKCKVCDKRFTRPSSLQTHMYSHTGERPFACDVEGCGRQFSVVSNLRRHRKVHKGHSDTETVSNAGSV